MTPSSASRRSRKSRRGQSARNSGPEITRRRCFFGDCDVSSIGANRSRAYRRRGNRNFTGKHVRRSVAPLAKVYKLNLQGLAAVPQPSPSARLASTRRAIFAWQALDAEQFDVFPNRGRAEREHQYTASEIGSPHKGPTGNGAKAPRTRADSRCGDLNAVTAMATNSPRSIFVCNSTDTAGVSSFTCIIQLLRIDLSQQ